MPPPHLPDLLSVLLPDSYLSVSGISDALSPVFVIVAALCHVQGEDLGDGLPGFTWFSGT